MASYKKIDADVLREWDEQYDSSIDDRAMHDRGEFLRAFPADSLHSMSIEDYVVGKQKPTFCNYVEAKTKSWAVIQGATASKFGVYFGKIKGDEKLKYRPTRKFGRTYLEAFKNVKMAILDLVDCGGRKYPDFEKIDENPLSQMFKAKILSLYYPDKFMSVCSEEHLEELAVKFGCEDGLFKSEYQSLLVDVKNSNPATAGWSNKKFVSFLYATYIKKSDNVVSSSPQKTSKRHTSVNMEDVADARREIGEKAEAFAMQWEENRLAGAGIQGQIIDRRNKPSYGFDFESYTKKNVKRYIEVKSVGKTGQGGAYRFFLSENEHCVSISKEHIDQYFFYLVYFDGASEPCDLYLVLAKDIYSIGSMRPAAYVVTFDKEK